MKLVKPTNKRREVAVRLKIKEFNFLQSFVCNFIKQIEDAENKYYKSYELAVGRSFCNGDNDNKVLGDEITVDFRKHELPILQEFVKNKVKQLELAENRRFVDQESLIKKFLTLSEFHE